MKWIDYMNMMFAANCYTDDGRVTISIIDNNHISILVVGETEIVDINGLTDYGILMRIMIVVDKLYDDGHCIMASPNF